MSHQQTFRLLKELIQIVKNCERKLDKLLEEFQGLGVSRKSFVPGAFVSLPKHLRRSMQAITILGEATAHEVSEKTSRSRAAESDYLNQLVDRGFLKKERRGKEVVFQVFSLHTICPMCGERVPLNMNFCSRCGAPMYRPTRQLQNNFERKR